jgi:hypothetical protein
MAYQWGRSQATATRLLSKFGMAVELKKKVVSFNPESSAKSIAIQTALFWGVQMSTREAEQEFSAIELEDGDLPLWMSVGALVPVKGDTVTTNTIDAGKQVWNIEYVDIEAPGGVTLLYKVQLRK